MYGLPKIVCCACDSSLRLDASSKCFMFVHVISSFKSLIAGSHVLLAFLILFLCVILHTMLSGKSLKLLCILPFGM